MFSHKNRIKTRFSKVSRKFEDFPRHSYSCDIIMTRVMKDQVTKTSKGN